jgi:hypothetical protein
MAYWSALINQKQFIDIFLEKMVSFLLIFRPIVCPSLGKCLVTPMFTSRGPTDPPYTCLLFEVMTFHGAKNIEWRVK